MKLISYRNNNQLLHQKQSGFSSGHSTESALILKTDTWLNIINDGNFVGCVSVHFRLVDHKLLLRKLIYYKLSNLSLSWFECYVHNRKQHVIINGNETVQCGVRIDSWSIDIFIFL